MKLTISEVAVILCLFVDVHTLMVNDDIDVNEVAVPFYVYLEIFRFPNLGGEHIHFGGGTLITVYSILTVAQNVYGFKSWQAGLGGRRINELTWKIIDMYTIHPNYNGSDLANNIAILNFHQPMSPYSTNIVPIVWSPPPGGGTNIPFDRQVGDIVGFGFGRTGGGGGGEQQPVILQYAQVTVLSQVECGAAYPHLIRNKQLENHFCANNLTTGTNICGGDQGGPIYSSETGLVFGIQSFNRVADCTRPDSGPAAFIMVSRYEEWINQNSRQIN